MAREPGPLAQFWAELLGRQVTQDSFGLRVSGPTAEIALRFVPSDIERTVPSRLHLHVATETARHQDMTVQRAVRLGARPLDVGQAADDQHVVLADPDGNAFCVIEPDNSFLAGCGLLAEVACDGGRAAGVFWSSALSWPLVWDQDDETAVQSPAGGTKVAWGGASTPGCDTGRAVLELNLVGGDGPAELARLLSLGASEREVAGDNVWWLTDPDGARFRLLVR